MERFSLQSGSGDYDDEALDEEDEIGEDDDIESETEVVPSVHIVPTMPSPVFPEATASHPHRHHHGEVEPGLGISVMPEHVSNVGYRLPTSPVVYGTVVPVPTPVLVSQLSLVTVNLWFKKHATIIIPVKLLTA